MAGIVVLAKDVRPGDVAYLRTSGEFLPREVYVEMVELGQHTLRIWGPGHSTYLVHPYEVMAVERAD